MSGPRYPQFCALARAAEIVGERWTLLAVREMLLGPKRFTDLSARLSGVSPTVLTARLNALIESGVVRRVTSQPFNVQAYELTESGRELQPAIRELIRWGGRFLFPMKPDDAFEPDWVLLALDAIVRDTPTPPRKVVLRVRHKSQAASFLVQGGPDGTKSSRATGPAAPPSKRASTPSCGSSPPRFRSSKRLRTGWRPWRARSRWPALCHACST